MRSSRDINKILEVSKALFSKTEKFKETYFSAVEEFTRHPANNFKNTLPILVLILENKDTAVGDLLIQNVAFPILCMSYPKFQAQDQEIKNNIITKLNTAITTLTDNISLSTAINQKLNSCIFFPTCLNKLISEYAAEDINTGHDILLKPAESDLLSKKEMQIARKNKTPILIHKKLTNDKGIPTDSLSIYGNCDGLWSETTLDLSPSDVAALLPELPFDEKILKSADIRLTDSLKEILEKGHTHYIDYTPAALKC